MNKGHALQTLSAILLCASMISSLLVLTPSPAAAAPSDAWIEGTVTDGGMNPIENVYILYMPMMSSGIMGSGWTDSAGHYNVTVIGGVQYLVMGFHGGYWGVNATVSPNSGETSTIDFVMSSIAPALDDVVLRGQVTDELGNPVTVGNVIGYVYDPVNGGQGAPKYGNLTTTDASGNFTVNVTASAIGGGVAVFDVPGYPMGENATQDPFVSGQTYWFNITLQPMSYTDDAVIYGIVTDATTDLPLEGVLVSFQSWNMWNQQGSYSNMTFTDASGHYEMNVTNGTANIWFSSSGYSMYQYSGVSVPANSSLEFNAQLLPTTATIRGNVTVVGTGSPIANARVFLTDGGGNFSMALTNGAGQYLLNAFSGSGLGLGAEADGYSRNMTIVNVTDGDNLWYDFGLRAVDAWLAGKVTDAISGVPIENAGVWLHNDYFQNWMPTNATGDYNFTQVVSGSFTIDINVANYMSYSDSIDVLPGGNVYDATLMPWNIPNTCKLWGYVNDSSSLTGIANAQVEIGMGPPNYQEYNQTTTNATGYYEMWVPPVDLLYVASAADHRHAEGSFDASGLTEYRLEVLLDTDLWGPNVTYDQTVLENVTWFNPTLYNIVVQDIDPQFFALAQFMYSESVLGLDYYYMIAMNSDSFDPLSQNANNLPYMQMGDTYTITYAWDTTMASAGWLWNNTDEQYLGVWQFWQGPDVYYAIRANYTNASMTGWEQGTAFFDGSTGYFLWFSFDNGMLPVAYPSDLTGIIGPQVSEIQVDPIGGWWTWIGGVMMGEWDVVGLNFTADPLVPSGEYASVFSASDFGNHGNGTIEFFTVDNDLPVPDAGHDQTVVENTAATFDGSGSSDNVGIVNYTWNFTDNGVPIEVYGVTASYNFTEVGSHEVTLTVTDGAGHMNSTTTLVEVVADQPPFAYAGLDQPVMVGDLVQFNGSGSYDDVNIVNWTWTFDYDGSTVVLYGSNPTFIFWIEDVYDVTLTVTDTAGQTSTDMVQITVSGMIPEFPTLLLPVIGLAAVVLVARLRKRR